MQQALNDNRSDHFINILELALEKTKNTHGPYRLEPSKLKMVTSRSFDSLNKNKWIDVLWTMTTEQREKEALPIRVPLEKGLIGYRLLMINKSDQEKFKSITTLKQLKQLKAGQESVWPDTKILQANQIKVEISPDYESLFGMLKGKRFDYFPRSIIEIVDEVKWHDDLMIEESLALYYPAATYFFVSKNNHRLAERLKTGLQLAMNDGSFDRLFFDDENVRWAVNIVKNHKRKVFKLDNPLLSKETPSLGIESWQK